MEESVEASMVDREMRGGARSGREVVVVVMMEKKGRAGRGALIGALEACPAGLRTLEIAECSSRRRSGL